MTPVLGYAASMWAQKPKNVVAETPQKAIATAAKINAKTTDIKTPSLEANIHKPSSPTNTAPNNNVQVNPDILASRLAATHTWLNSQNPNTVTIQLMGSSSDAQLQNDLELLSQQVELDNIYIYRTKVNNQPFLTVLYGSFANRVDAMQALKKLPLELQKNRPQLRTIAGVLQEIN